MSPVANKFEFEGCKVDISQLQKYLERGCLDTAYQSIYKDELSLSCRKQDVDSLCALYINTLSRAENQLFDSPSNSLLEAYAALHREFQTLIDITGCSFQYDFLIVVPVADRPEQLRRCLNSLLTCQQLYCYGGLRDNNFKKVSVLVADDSKELSSRCDIEAISSEFSVKGLSVSYFSQQQQSNIYEKCIKSDPDHADRVLGHLNRDAFYHKGASVMRNLVYLYLQSIELEDSTIIHFIDSDQEFNVNLERNDSFYGLNYYYIWNSVFYNQRVQVATGKVVGDPPVSPAVMSSRMLDDVNGFVDKVLDYLPGASCCFHIDNENSANAASYHDMADLFGFVAKTDSVSFKCDIKEPHIIDDVIEKFATELTAFFHGSHPTRYDSYRHCPGDMCVDDARTVYTGNYLIRKNMLDFVMPFASLKLRMAGPVMGRILKSRHGCGFVSANVPMRHMRTLMDSDESEYRSGVIPRQDIIDLSSEFVRQFYGDVMLFSVSRIASMQDQVQNGESIINLVDYVVNDVHNEMLVNYADKQKSIVSKLSHLECKLITLSKKKFKNNTVIDDKFRLFLDTIKYHYGDESVPVNRIHAEGQSYLSLIKSSLCNHLADCRESGFYL